MCQQNVSKWHPGSVCKSTRIAVVAELVRLKRERKRTLCQQEGGCPVGYGYANRLSFAE